MKNFFKKIDDFIVNIDFITIVAILIILLSNFAILFLLKLYKVSTFDSILFCLGFGLYFSFFRVVIDNFNNNNGGTY